MSKLMNLFPRHAITLNHPRSISLRTISTCSSRICYQKNNTQVENRDKSQDYVPVYKLPYIRPLALINRLKFYHTVLTVASVPTTAALYQLKYISNEAMEFTTILGLTGCLTLYSLGFLTTKLVGIVYYNEKTKTAKLSYIDFWGRRKNQEIPVDDIIPISELPVAAMDGLFLTMRRFSSAKDTFKISLRFGEILDDKIKQVF